MPRFIRENGIYLNSNNNNCQHNDINDNTGSISSSTELDSH